MLFQIYQQIFFSVGHKRNYS